jgi:hypothetical protein
VPVRKITRSPAFFQGMIHITIIFKFSNIPSK